jgi:ABC-type sugar transport system ATPase subunit
VALGRALVLRPACLLLDEPLAHLDAPRRASTQAHIRAVRERTGATVLYVTHDQDEALAMADRLGVMRAGELLQLGTPEELHDRPADRFVAAFLGTPAMNFLPGTLRLAGAEVTGGGGVGQGESVVFEESPASAGEPRAGAGGALAAGQPWRTALPGRDDLRPHAGRDVVLGVRPAAMTLEAAASRASAVLAGVVESTRVAGEGTDITLRTGAGRLVVCRASGRLRVRSGEPVRIAFSVGDAHVFEPGERGTRLGG